MSLSLHLFLYLCLSLSLSHSCCLPLFASVFLSVCLSLHHSLPLVGFVFVCLSVCLPVSVPISVRLSICLYLCRFHSLCLSPSDVWCSFTFSGRRTRRYLLYGDGLTLCFSFPFFISRCLLSLSLSFSKVLPASLFYP